MSTRKRILFVDDEPAILTGLEHLFYKDRRRWEMVFALGAQRALDAHRTTPFDVVVSDMRMPGIDGATLLLMIKDECPATGRILLTGYADDDAIARARSVLDHLLSKPCPLVELRRAIEHRLAASGNGRGTTATIRRPRGITRAPRH